MRGYCPYHVALSSTSGIVALVGRSPRGGSAQPASVPGDGFPAYLILVGLQAVVVYACLTCVVQDRMLVAVYAASAVLIPA